MEWKGSKAIGPEGEKGLTRGVVGREILPVSSLLVGESKLLFLSCLAVLGCREPGFHLWMGITKALAYLLFGLPFSFLCFGNTVVLFWCLMKTHLKNLKNYSFVGFWFFLTVNQKSISWPALHISSERQKPAAERLMKSNLTKPDCAFLSRLSAGSSP